MESLTETTAKASTTVSVASTAGAHLATEKGNKASQSTAGVSESALSSTSTSWTSATVAVNGDASRTVGKGYGTPIGHALQGTLRSAPNKGSDSGGVALAETAQHTTQKQGATTRGLRRCPETTLRTGTPS